MPKSPPSTITPDTATHVIEEVPIGEELYMDLPGEEEKPVGPVIPRNRQPDPENRTSDIMLEFNNNNNNPFPPS